MNDIERDRIGRHVHELLCGLNADASHSAEHSLEKLVLEHAPLATAERRSQIVDDVRARIDGLGPLHEFAADGSVSEILVNPGGDVWVERRGVLEKTGRHMASNDAEHLLRRLASQAGRRIDLRTPSVDARLPDGSRLHGILPPLAVDGPCVTIRRFSPTKIRLEELCDLEALQILEKAVAQSRSLVVVGATSSGKTTLLNALGSRIPPGTRVITIEDSAELNLGGDHVVRLETRIANESAPAVEIRELIRHALRMRPDRIICGEMRGAEALDLIQAMNTGHAGGMTTVHANSPSDAMRRIETMMLTADADLPLPAIREQLSSCIDFVVMMSRQDSGGRAVSQICQMPDVPSPGWELDCVYKSKMES